MMTFWYSFLFSQDFPNILFFVLEQWAFFRVFHPLKDITYNKVLVDSFSQTLFLAEHPTLRLQPGLVVLWASGAADLLPGCSSGTLLPVLLDWAALPSLGPHIFLFLSLLPHVAGIHPQATSYKKVYGN